MPDSITYPFGIFGSTLSQFTYDSLGALSLYVNHSFVRVQAMISYSIPAESLAREYGAFHKVVVEMTPFNWTIITEINSWIP